MADKETKTLDVPEHEDIKLIATHEPDGFETWDGMAIDPCWRGTLRRVSTGEMLLDEWGEVYTFGHGSVEELLKLACDLLRCDFDDDYQYDGVPEW